MIIVSNIIGIIYYASIIYEYIFWVYILLSFFPINEDNFLVRILTAICGPLYNSLLRILPRLRIGPLDLSPLYVVIFLRIVQFILRSIQSKIIPGI